MFLQSIISGTSEGSRLYDWLLRNVIHKSTLSKHSSVEMEQAERYLSINTQIINDMQGSSRCIHKAWRSAYIGS